MPRSQVDVELLAKTGKATTGLKQFKTAMTGVGKETEKSGAKLDRFKDGLDDIGPAARKTFAIATAAIGGTTLAFASYERELKNVQNISGQTDAQMAQMTERFMELPPALGEADDLMKALYQTISSGITDPAKAFEVVVASAKAAKGNLSDMAQTVDGLTSVLNAYNLESTEAIVILDSMTKTVDLGKLTFGDLSDNIGKGISIAASAGVTYNELLSVLATLTLNGLSVEEAMTAIRNIMLVALKPTKEVRDNMADLGVDMSATALQTQGFAAWMGTAAEAVQGSAEMTAQLFPNIRALNGAMKLASTDGLAKYNDILGQIGDSSGKVQGNFDNMRESAGAAFKSMTAEFKKVGIAFGALAAEDIVPLVHSITSLLTTIKQLDEPTKRTIVQTTALAAAFSGIVLILPKAIAAYTLLKGALFVTSTASVSAAGGLKLFTGAAVTSGNAAAVAAVKVRLFTVAMGAAVVAGLALQYGINKLADHINKSSTAMNKSSVEITRRTRAVNEAARAEGISLSALASKLNVTATAEKNLQEALVERLASLRAQGKITAEGERLLKGYSKELVQSAKAQEDQTEATEDGTDAADGLTDAMVSLNKETETAAELAKREREERDKLNEKIEAQERYARGLTLEMENLEGSFSIVGTTMAATSGETSYLQRQMGIAFDRVLSLDGGMANLTISTIGASGAMAGLGDELSDTQKWEAALGAITVNLRESFGIAVVEGLLDGFDDVGEFLEDIFSNWADAFLDVWTEKVFRGEEFLAAFAAGGMTPLEAMQGFTGEAGQNQLLYGLGGAGMMYQGMQQGGAGGFMQGAMGGIGMLGAIWPLLGMSGPPGWIALGAAAIIGGIAGLFAGGGDETPWFSTRYEPDTGFDVYRSGGYSPLSELNDASFNRSLNAALLSTRDAFRGLTSLFEMPELFDLVGVIEATDFGQFEGTADQFSKWIKDVWLPGTMDDVFGAAIDAGFAAWGVDPSTVDRLRRELSQLPLEQQLGAMEEYISAVVQGAKLAEALDWQSITEEVGKSPREAFVGLMTDTLADIDLAMAGWDQLSLIEQARQASDIQALMTSAYETQIRYLQQIDQIAKGIQASIGAQVEGLRLGGMGDIEQAEYASEQIAAIFGQLSAGDLSPDVVQMLVGDAQRYIDLLAQIMGEEGLAGRMPDVIADFMGGQAWLGDLEDIFPAGGVPADWTGREFLIAMLERLGAASQGALEEARQEAALLNQQYLEELTLINERLSSFSGSVDYLAGGDNQAGGLDGLGRGFDDLAEDAFNLGESFREVIEILDTIGIGGAGGPIIVPQTQIDVHGSAADLVEIVETVVYRALERENVEAV